MVVPEFIRFYQGYTVNDVMTEFAKTFFSLINSMYQIKAEENINNISVIGVAINGDNEAVSELEKASRGISGIVEEVRTIENVRKQK